MTDQRWVWIIRVWWEHDAQLAGPVLRGSVQQLGREQARYFASVEGLVELIQTILPPTPASLIDAPPMAES